MNKTININLAGTFFHVDEDAFGKLQRYLDAIKKSLSDPQGGDEIIRDIEARIAELFSEKLEESTQVVTLKELDEVIAVMGQPEDYMVDEEIFDDAPKSSYSRKSKTDRRQLFRDVDDKVIAGVSTGMGHYLGLDAVWVRLIWVILFFATSGVAIPIYILFWIIVPPALTTSEKLKMTREPINISNIEKKFKEGYENVSEKVKNVDYDKHGKQIKSSATGFFDTLGSILFTLLKVLIKFIGVLIIISALVSLVSLIVFLASAGSVGFWGGGELTDWYNLVVTSNSPLWYVSILAFFAFGIPFFVLFILGMKMLVSNLKSIGTPAKIALLVVWVASIIGLSIFFLGIASEYSFKGEHVTEEVLPIRSGDTLKLQMVSEYQYDDLMERRGNLDIKYDENDNKYIYSTDVRLIVRSTKDSIGRVLIEKQADGDSYATARKRAQAIDYDYNFDGETLSLNSYFTTGIDNKYRDQEIQLIVYLPEGTILYADDNTYTYHRNDSRYRDILDNGDEEKYLIIEDGETRCLDCPAEEDSNDDSWEDEWENDDEGAIYIKDSDGDFVRIDKNGIKIQENDSNTIIIQKSGKESDTLSVQDTLKVNIGG